MLSRLAGHATGLEECFSRQLDAVTEAGVDHDVANVRDKTAKKLRVGRDSDVNRVTGVTRQDRCQARPLTIGQFGRGADVGDPSVGLFRHQVDKSSQ
jgi:hypothetical protein